MLDEKRLSFSKKSTKLHSDRLNTDRGCSYTLSILQTGSYSSRSDVTLLIFSASSYFQARTRSCGPNAFSKPCGGHLRVNWTGTCGGGGGDDTFVVLIFGRFQQLDEFNTDVKLHGNDQGDLQQDQLQLLNTWETRKLSW